MIDDRVQRIANALFKLLPKCLRRNHIVAGTADATEDSTWVMEDCVKFLFLHDVSNQRNLISMIQNREVLLEPDMFRPAPQDSRTESMKRADSDPLATEKSFHSRAHFASGLVREGQSQDLIRRHSPLQQTRDAMRNDTSFPGTWSRKNKEWSFEMFNSLMLGIREAGCDRWGVDRQNKAPRSCGKAID